MFEGGLAFYDRGLKWVLAHQLTTLLTAIGTLALTVLLAVLIPKGFFPAQDTGLLLGVTEAGPDVSFAPACSSCRSARATPCATIPTC